MSSATDPYQPIERKVKMRMHIKTQGPLITRDIDVLTELRKKCKVLISMTIETDREDIKRVFAPYGPGIKLRIKALKEIHEAGIPTQASISPVLPFTPDFPKALSGIAQHIWIDTLSIGDGAMGKRHQGCHICLRSMI